MSLNAQIHWHRTHLDLRLWLDRNHIFGWFNHHHCWWGGYCFFYFGGNFGLLNSLSLDILK